jgi:hypothetical protein
MLKAFVFLPYIVASVLMLVVAVLIAIACRTGQDFSDQSS